MQNFDYFMGLIVPAVNFSIFLTLAIYLFKKPLRQMSKKRLDDYQVAFNTANEAKPLLRRNIELRSNGIFRKNH